MLFIFSPVLIGSKSFSSIFSDLSFVLGLGLRSELEQMIALSTRTDLERRIAFVYDIDPWCSLGDKEHSDVFFSIQFQKLFEVVNHNASSMRCKKIALSATLTLLLILTQLSWHVPSVRASPSPSATTVEWALPTALSNPYSLVVYEGKVYFTEQDNRIGCLDPYANTIAEWTVPTSTSGLRCIAIYEGKVWFTEYYSDKIGRLDPSTNTITEWSLWGPRDGWTGPYDIAVYGGKVYFTEVEGSQGKGKRVGRLDPSINRITEWFSAPALEHVPWGIAVDTSGKVWFTRGPSEADCKISMLDPSRNTFKEWALPDAFTAPWHLTISSDGKVWFTEYYGRDKIGCLDSKTSKLMEWNVPTPTSYPHGIVEDAMGNIYFTEYEDNQIGKLKPKGGTTRKITDVTQVAVTTDSYTSSPTSAIVTPTTNTITPASSTVSSIESGSFTEWDIPTTDSKPTDIFTEDGTTFYLTESSGNNIAQFIPQYTLTEWAVPLGYYDKVPFAIAVSSGKVWFTEVRGAEGPGNKIGRLDPSTNKITEWTIPTEKSEPRGIAVYSGKVWFTENLGGPDPYDPDDYNKIGRLDPSTNTITEWTLPMPGNPYNGPYGITVYGGKVWFTEDAGNKIGCLDPSTDMFTEWAVPTIYSWPRCITVYGGKVWFTEYYEFSSKIGCLDPSTNTITEWATPTESSWPYDIAVYGGKVWFTEHIGQKIGCLDPSTNAITEWSIPAPGFKQPYGIAMYGGKVWFVDFNWPALDKLYPIGGEVTIVTPVSTVVSPAIMSQTPIATVVTPTTTTVTPVKTELTCQIYGQFTLWATPVNGYNRFPFRVAVPGGGEVWFTDQVKINKFG